MFIFELFGIVFWVVVAVYLFLTTVFVGKSKIAFPIVSTALLLLFLQFLTPLDLLSKLKDGGYIYALKAFGLYVLIGIMWSFLRWWRGCRKLSHFVNDSIDEFKAKKPTSGKYGHETAMSFSAWFSSTKASEYRIFCEEVFDCEGLFNSISTETVIPQLGRNKSVVASWIAFWPLSIIARFIGHWIVDFWQSIVRALTGVYREIANQAFASTHKKLKEVTVVVEAKDEK